jgi:hypothetical protein
MLNKKLLELEKKNMIYLFKYKSTTSWINIKNYLYTKNSGMEFFAENKYKINKKLFIKYTILSLKNLFFKKEKNVDFLFVSAGSGMIKIKNETIDIYKTKLLGNNFEYWVSYDNLENFENKINYVKYNNIVIFSLIFAPIKSLFAKILMKFIKLENKIEQLLKEMNLHYDINEIKYIHAKFIIGYEIYKIFFKKNKIKKAIIVSAYSNSDLIGALKYHNIEVFERQHGIIGPMHRGYNYAVKSDLLPTPDKVIVYDEFWKQELIDGGYFKEDNILIEPKIQYNYIKEIDIFDKPYILFTGQGIKHKEIENFIKNSLDYLKNNNIYFVYLPHPAEQDINFKINSNYVKILRDKEYITEQYIKNSIAHISIYSSCHFDAINLLGKTYVFDIMNHNIMKYYKTKYPKKFIFIKEIRDMQL